MDSAFSDIARDELCYPAPRELAGNAALAAAGLGRFHFVLRRYPAILHCKDTEVGAVAKVSINISIPCGYCDLHSWYSLRVVLSAHNSAALNSEDTPFDERGRNFAVRALQYAAESLPRYAHAHGGGFLIETIVIRETQGLEFIEAEHSLRKSGGRNARWFEHSRGWRTADVAFA